jgi:hypothetical protein
MLFSLSLSLSLSLSHDQSMAKHATNAACFCCCASQISAQLGIYLVETIMLHVLLQSSYSPFLSRQSSYITTTAADRYNSWRKLLKCPAAAAAAAAASAAAAAAGRKEDSLYSCRHEHLEEGGR